jgi:hypothetical protein
MLSARWHRRKIFEEQVMSANTGRAWVNLAAQTEIPQGFLGSHLPGQTGIRARPTIHSFLTWNLISSKWRKFLLGRYCGIAPQSMINHLSLLSSAWCQRFCERINGYKHCFRAGQTLFESQLCHLLAEGHGANQLTFLSLLGFNVSKMGVK